LEYINFYIAFLNIFYVVYCMVKIMLKGKAKILVPNKRGKTGLIYIPADIVKDSSFPFKPNEEVTIKIEGEKLVIEKRKKGEEN